MRLSLAIALCLTVAYAQLPEPKPVQAEEPQKVLTYTGKPLRLPFACKSAEIEQFALSCTLDEPCPVYLELASVAAQGDRIFAAGNLHTTSVTISSVLLRSDDGGRSWVEPYERIPLAGLDQMQFLDLEAGWVSGHILGAFPKNPFLLLTTDGGKTWSRKDILSEGGFGTIEHFWFDSRNSGTLILDRTRAEEGRYELYESMTGGESWTLRESSSKPIPFKREKPAAALRTRADGPSKSYVIEKLLGGRWHTLARFLVDVGECRPEEPESPSPPPPELEPAESEAPRTAPSPKPVGPRRPPTLKKP